MNSQLNNDINFNQIKVYFFKGIRYWYIIVIALILGASYGYYKNRYLIPNYEISGRVLVKDEWKGGYGADAFLPGMEIINERNRLANEMGIIRSFPLMLDAVSNVPDLHISYFDVGNVKKSDNYKKNPFVVKIDTIANENFYHGGKSIRYINGKSFLLSTDRFEKSEGTRYNFGEKINLNGSIFSVESTQFYPAMLEKTYEFQVNRLEYLAKYYLDATGLSIDIDEASSIIIVTVNGINPQKEIDAINSIMESFIQYGLDESRHISKNTLEFVTEQLNIVHDSLVLAEERMEKFKEDAGEKLINIEGENLIAQVTELEKAKLELEFTLTFSQSTINYIKEHDDARGIVIPYFITRQSALFDLMQNLIDKYNVRESLKSNANENNHRMILLQKEIGVAKDILLENLKSLKNKSENDLLIIKNQLSYLNDKIAKVPKVEREYTIALRDYSIQNQLYTLLLNKKEQADIANAASIPKATILDYASNFRVINKSPTSKSIYIKNILIGLVLSILLIILLEIINNKIIDKSDIENNSKIPIIGSIGHNINETNLLLLNSPKSLLSEAFRTIRTNIQYLSRGEGSKIVLLTSSVSGEGKTFCSMNIASSFALLEKKTILIGADLRKPRIYDDFGLSNSIGLSSYLVGANNLETVTQHTSNPFLDIITSGPIPPNPSELLSSNEFKALIEILRKTYDRIILDTPPIGLVTDARLLIEESDVILLIIRQRHTSIPNLKKISDDLIPYIAKTGLVVNDIKLNKVGYGSYGYGYGYGYGNGYGYGYGLYEEDNKKNTSKPSFLNKFKRG